MFFRFLIIHKILQAIVIQNEFDIFSSPCKYPIVYLINNGAGLPQEKCR